MFLFGKKNEEPKPTAKPAAPSPAAKPAQGVNPDDFFGDIDRKPKQEAETYRPVIKTEEAKPDIEAPEVEGLREAPLPAPVSTITDVSTHEIDTDILPDKTLIPPPVPFEIDEPEAQKPAGGDDFFADLDRKAARLKKANSLVIEPPSTESLRETAPPPPESTIVNVETDTVETDVLPVKPPVEGYIGSMNDADVDEEGAMALEFKHFKEEREEDGSLEYDNETYEGIDIRTAAPVDVEKIEEE